MKLSIEKNAGMALLAGSILMLATMAIHPSGGNLQHMLRIATINMVSHSLALIAIPFLGLGFWGLTRRIDPKNFLSLLAFAIMLTGLVAGMLAAGINGLALPIYIKNYHGANEVVALSLKPVLKYGLALNHAFDFVFIGAVSLSILCWSVTILYIKRLPLWFGYFGILLSLAGITILASGYVLVSLHGFRLFIFSNVIWISGAGIILLRLKHEI